MERGVEAAEKEPNKPISISTSEEASKAPKSIEKGVVVSSSETRHYRTPHQEDPKIQEAAAPQFAHLADDSSDPPDFVVLRGRVKIANGTVVYLPAINLSEILQDLKEAKQNYASTQMRNQSARVAERKREAWASIQEQFNSELKRLLIARQEKAKAAEAA